MFFIGQKLQSQSMRTPGSHRRGCSCGDDRVGVQLEIDGESTYAEFYKKDGMSGLLTAVKAVDPPSRHKWHTFWQKHNNIGGCCPLTCFKKMLDRQLNRQKMMSIT